MDKLSNLKKAISETYVKLDDDSYIESGDIIAINYYRPRYFIAEYIIYNNNILLLLHSLFESFHFTIFNFFYVSAKNKNFSYTAKKLYDESLTKTNEELSNYILSKSLFFYKTDLHNLKQSEINWFKHKQKGVLFRKNWNNIPTLYLQNISLFNGSLYSGSLLLQTTNNSYTSVYLSINNIHKEYIWLQKKLC